jgi:hypothetical protein
MKVSVVFTMILVGAAATATAEPKQEETSGRVSLNENKPHDDAPRQPGDWVELASPTPAKHGTEFVIVGKDAGAFSKLRLQAAKGKTIVRKVKVFFADGDDKFAVKTVQLDKILPQGKSTYIDLGDSRTIDRIVVQTETYTGGQYAVYGSSGDGVVGSR